MKSPRTMTSLVNEYVEFRRRLGFTFRSVGLELGLFAKYADRAHHKGPITTDLVVEWATSTTKPSPEYRAWRFNAIRSFLFHQATEDPRNEVPPRGLLGPGFRRAQPHIFSATEVSALLRATNALGPAGGLRPKTYTTLFGLLAATGLRISEALGLKCADVDLNACVLRIEKAKGGRERMVPLHRTAGAALRLYARARRRRHPLPESNAFFLTERGTAVTYPWVTRTFRKIRAQLAWRGRSPPRLHDLRHTFAVRNLLRWCRAGQNVDSKITLLSKYLGHVNVTGTYWYLTAVPELMALTSARFERWAVPPGEQ
jgi:integrase